MYSRIYVPDSSFQAAAESWQRSRSCARTAGATPVRMYVLLTQLAMMLCLVLGLALTASAQASGDTRDVSISGPTPPQPPEVVTRESIDRVTVRATRIAEPMVLDGRLDEETYARVASIGGFIQQEPREGEPASERTNVWLLFDDRNIYVSARCWDSHPERLVSKEMRRDHSGLYENDVFMVTLDTFHDRRNAFAFLVNLSGGLSDAYITDERDFNRDWNTVWDAKTARFEQGWTVEIVIPFKSLRYPAGQAQVWGVNFRRQVGWKNENTFLTRIPGVLRRSGHHKVSSSATLVGIETPKSVRNVEIRPYGIADMTTDRISAPPISNAVGWDAGLDVKIGVTKGLTADVSLNTDFAQVEVDEQQVNLTRFNVFFPEKRDFFLEGQGIFNFGGVRGGGRSFIGPGGAMSGTNPSPADVPTLFFSRRIGLDNGQKVPVRVGARVTGKAGPYSIGLLDIQTGDEPRFGVPSTNFGVVRLKRDILRRSAIGVLFTNRSATASGQGTNQLFGVDGVFSFYENLNVNTYVAKTRTGGSAGRDGSYRVQLDYAADRYGLQLEHNFLDERFNPEVGFIRRRAFRRSSTFIRFSPRPVSIKAVRKFTWDATYDYITDVDGQLQSRYAEAAFRTDLQNGDSMAVEYALNFEFLLKPFAIAEDVTLPIGGYSFPEARVMYYFGPQRRMSGTLKVTRGRFYDGTRTEFATFKNRITITSQISIEPGLTVDWVELPSGRFTTTLGVARLTWALTPRMVFGALTQYDSTTHALGTNIRFRWEYTPGSDLFIVYNDNRETGHRSAPILQSRSLVVKLTRMFRR